MNMSEEELEDLCLDIVHTLDAERRLQGVREADIQDVMGVNPGTWYELLKHGRCRLTTLVLAAEGLGYSVRLVKRDR